MIRFVFGLAAVVAVYLGWQWYSGDPAAAGEDPSPFENAPSTPEPGPEADAKVVTVPEGAKVDEMPAPAQAEPGSFRRLNRSEGAEFEGLARALSAAVTRTDTLEGLFGVLGRTNAFLHSEVGRKAARKAVAKILAQPPDVAVKRMSALLERCMQGPIAAEDAAAGALVDELYRKHKVLVDRVVFNPANVEKARSHLVQPGETLDRIARRFRKQDIFVEGWTLCYVNRIGQPNRLRAGVTIKVPTEPIWAKVEKESFLMAVYVGETIVRLYWVAHGTDDKTPVTTFRVGAKLSKPDWYAPDGHVYAYGHPKNVLGDYFVKFDHETYQGFGAHGTSEPESIRRRASLGCLRLRDADIEEFFRFVPQGAKVVIAATQ